MRIITMRNLLKVIWILMACSNMTPPHLVLFNIYITFHIFFKNRNNTLVKYIRRRTSIQLWKIQNNFNKLKLFRLLYYNAMHVGCVNHVLISLHRTSNVKHVSVNDMLSILFSCSKAKLSKPYMTYSSKINSKFIKVQSTNTLHINSYII